MRVIVQILLKELKQLVRSPGMILILLLCPFITVGIVPFGMGNETRVKVDVVDNSFSARGREVTERLSHSPNVMQASFSPSVSVSQERMDRNLIDAIVIVPAGGGPCQLIVDGSHNISGRDASTFLTIQLSSPPSTPGVNVHTRFISGVGNTHYFMSTMMALLLAIIACSLSTLSVVTEMERRTLEYFRSIGMGMGLYVWSKILVYTLISVLVQLLGLLIARWFHGFTPACPLWAYLLLCACFASSLSAIGIIIASYTGNVVRAIYSEVFVFLILALLSTMFAPLDYMSDGWAETRYLNPFFWMADGSWSLLLKGLRPVDILPHYLLLALFTVVLSTLSVFRLRKVA